MNISVLSVLRDCTSCQMCAAACPVDAIEIRLDDDGFYRPWVIAERCIDCGVCVKVCYRFDKDIVETSKDELENMPLYAASARDNRLVSQVTSGGVADLLAKQLIAEGYICIGVSYDDAETRALHTIACSPDETDAFRGSKYIQSYSYSAFRNLVRNCTGQKYAVFGTPCQIYGIHKYLATRKCRDRHVLIDLYCHGCPSLFLWRKYAEEVKSQIGKEKFVHLDFRSKARGWGNFCIAVTENHHRVFVSSPQKDEFYTLFFSDQVLNGACSDCQLRSTLAYTDIRLGDFWGKRYALNSRGVSAVSLVTKRGLTLFETLSPQLSICKRHPYRDFLPWQSYGKDYQPDMDLRRMLLHQLADPDIPLQQTVRTYYRKQGIRERLKRCIKHILYYMPYRIGFMIKRLFV